MRTTNQNLTVKILIVRKEVIDDARRYIPQPIVRKSSFLNVINERTLLIKPATKRIIVTAALIFTGND